MRRHGLQRRADHVRDVPLTADLRADHVGHVPLTADLRADRYHHCVWQSQTYQLFDVW